MNFYDFRQQNYHFFLINHKEFFIIFAHLTKADGRKLFPLWTRNR